MAKMGRPKKEINKKLFENLCGIQCTQKEICAVLEVTDKTLNTWCRKEYGTTFSEVFSQKREIGKVSLRRAGFELAQKNPAVHIFYAKNHLGMSDHIEVVDSTALEKITDVLDEIEVVADEAEQETS